MSINRTVTTSSLIIYVSIVGDTWFYDVSVRKSVYFKLILKLMIITQQQF